MKIKGLGCSMPERVVTNDDVLKEVEELSSPYLEDGQMGQVLTRIKTLFRMSGTQKRHLRHDGDRAYEYAKKAAEQALERAELKPTDIDLLLYVGVARGWVEPGMATFFQHELGMTNATGFDLLDACLSWLRGFHITHNFFKNGVYNNVMILNAEFFNEYHDYTIKSLDEVAYRFAQLTLGESATATILSNEDNGIEPYFEFKTDPSLHDLCKVPLPNIHSYNNAEKCPQVDPLRFFAYSAEMFKAAKKMIPEMYLNSQNLQNRHCDIAFGHSASKSLIDEVANQLHLEDQAVNLYPEFGNTVSASIPTAMCWALDHDRLKRGMQMMLFMGSAGFSVGICHMAY